MEPLSISKAGEKDIAALVTLINKAYRGETSRKGWTTEADFLNGIRIDKEGPAGPAEERKCCGAESIYPGWNYTRMRLP